MKAEDLKRWPLLFKKFKKNIKKHPMAYDMLNEYQKAKFNEPLKNYLKDMVGDISKAFVWNNSTQGYSFWEALHVDDIETAKALQPELFLIDNQVVEEDPISQFSIEILEWFLGLPEAGRAVTSHISLNDLKVTMEKLEYYYNTIKGIGCSIIACYQSDGSGKLVRCDADGNNPIVLMSWGRDCGN